MAQNNIQKYIDEHKPVRVPHGTMHPMARVTESDGKVVIIDRDQLVTNLTQNQDVITQFTGSIQSTMLANGGSVDIQIVPCDMLVKDVTIEIQCHNSDGTNTVTPCPAPLMIQRIEWYANGGSDLVQTQYGETIWFNQGMLFTNEALQSEAAVQNFSTAFGAGTAIAANGAARYWIPLVSCWLVQDSGMWLGNLKANLICRIFFRPSVESGTGVLALDKVFIHFGTKELASDTKAEIREQYANNNVERRILDSINMPVTQTFTASTPYTIILSSFSNVLVPFWLACFRSSISNASAGLRTFANIGDFAPYTLQNGQGQDLTGGSGFTYKERRHSDFPKRSPGTLLFNLPLVPMVHCENVLEPLQGRVDGAFPYTSNEKFVFTPDANWSSGSYTLDFYGYVFRHVHLNSNGRIEVLKK
jgi:hypothetical protein